MKIGEKIKKLRKVQGMTQEELGNEVGLQKAAINKYETGVVVNIKRGTIDRMSKVFRVSPVWLMDDEADWPPIPDTRANMLRGLESLDSEASKMFMENFEAREIGKLYLSLNPTNRATARAYMNFLKAQEEELEGNS